MKNTFGQSVNITLFGESHGAEIGAVIDGLAPGIPVDEAFMAHQLDLRRPAGKISTARHESDPFRLVSGVFEGKTTGTPLCILIPNNSTQSKDYAATRTLARPGHADYTAYAKYHGFEDYRGGGHFSGRITTPVVAAGAIALQALAAKGIYIGSHVARCAGVSDDPFAQGAELKQQLLDLNQKTFATLSEQAAADMQVAIEAAAADGDSVGGVLETAVYGMPAGVGEPWFDSLESVLSHALFSVPAVKGVQFGAGFDMVDARGSEFNDAFRMIDGQITTATNHNGGINGGISNGMPITFRCAVKPTPSIYKAQQTVDFFKNEDADLQIQGRHDPAIIHRARVVVDSVTALVLCDMLALRYGTDWLGPIQPEQPQAAVSENETDTVADTPSTAMEYGLIGEHLPHSFSKDIHEQLGEYTYELHEVAPDDLDAFMRAKNFRAINVTIPYKQEVIPYLDEIDPLAAEIGAVNCIVNKQGKLSGYNTDLAGMAALARRIGIDFAGKKVLICGTGGTSKTARTLALSQGADTVWRLSRRPKEGADYDDVITYAQAYGNHTDAQIIINTTPSGMFPENGTAAINLTPFTALEGVLDAVYNPLETTLVLDAHERDIPAEGGLYMLTAQAFYAAEHFLGRSLNVNALTEKVFTQIEAEKRNIVLIGMPGCGKSTVGALLSEKLARALVDTDELIIKNTGLTPAQIIEEMGEDIFREYEQQAVEQAGMQSGIIIATGGGALLRDANYRALKQNGRLYFIDRPLEDLIPTDDRPLSDSLDKLQALYDERYPRYTAVADEIIPADLPAADVAALIRERHFA